jgi:hypothetical protein
MSKLTLTGDNNTPAMPLSDSEVNHLRRVLAWLRCEYMLDESMVRGMLGAASQLVELGAVTPEVAGQHVSERAEQINRVPAYVRQGVKMLTKALQKHERGAGIVEEA